jgi:hypothetical protein
MASGEDRDAKAHPLRAIPTTDAPMVRYEPSASFAASDDDDSIDLASTGRSWSSASG